MFDAIDEDEFDFTSDDFGEFPTLLRMVEGYGYGLCQSKVLPFLSEFS